MFSYMVSMNSETLILGISRLKKYEAKVFFLRVLPRFLASFFARRNSASYLSITWLSIITVIALSVLLLAIYTNFEGTTGFEPVCVILQTTDSATHPCPHILISLELLKINLMPVTLPLITTPTPTMFLFPTVLKDIFETQPYY